MDLKNMEFEFTFNSLKCLENFDFDFAERVKKNPIKMISITEDLLYSALNNNPKKIISRQVVEKEIEKFINDESSDSDISDLLERLTTALGESNFFKKLRQKAETLEETEQN